ncbi:MAG: DUF2849 domain-containing protein [Loktanella sp.]|jgi:hypothetical protein|nr:DUF2849 domain-containing protein [Loktanella sp.]MDO7606794.1 DUF2849 domain-containing protein [Loktanella sp.]MDO7622189.1 DUF2849 domain-containing protein [Loktanella sp.]MDO7626495.1 DUF2849 domain-containing protein [Loktanella sp.]MDO7629365.1 DUF2849 domain-containing protein [Loktanella sp.]
MSRAFTPKVITANALLEGDAIWFTEDNTWSRNIAEAELITDEAHGDIRLLEAKADQSIVVGVYLAEAKKTNNGPAPTHFREAFRTRGPSNYSHGKQEA